MAVAPQPTQAVGSQLTPTMDKWTGLPTFPTQVGPVAQNPVRYTPDMTNVPAGLPPALAQAFGMQMNGPNPPKVEGMAAATAGNRQAYFNPSWYVDNNPDILAAWNSLSDKAKWTKEKYGQFHYANFGQNEGRVIGPNDPKLGQGAPAAAAQPNLPPDQLFNLQNLLAGMQAGRLPGIM